MTIKDISIAIGLVFLMSVNLIVQKIALDQISPYILGFLRVALVVPLVFFIPKPKKSLWTYFICGLFVFCLYLALSNYGIKELGANISSFITQLQVFFTILAFYIILGEKPTLNQTIGIFISFFGVYFLSATSSSEEYSLSGILISIASCVSFGLGTALTKKYKIGGNLQDMIWMALAASGPMLLTCFLLEGPIETYHEIVNITMPALFAAVFGAIAITLITASMWFSLLQRAPGSSVMPFMLLMPFFAIFLSHFILEETFSFHQFVAGIIVLIGVMIAQNLHLRLPVLYFWVKNRIVL